MHFDTRLRIIYFVLITNLMLCCCQHSDEQSYLSLIEFNRGGPNTNLILSSPHGGFLGANLTSRQENKLSNNEISSASLFQLPIGGCYNTTLDRCVYMLQGKLKSRGI